MKLPDGADVATIELNAAAKDAMTGLESRLAQMAEAYRVGDQEKLATFGGERHFDLATDTVRVIMEMARSPEAHAAGGPTYEVVALPSGKRATVEHAPQIVVRPELMDAIAAAGATYETAYENWVQVLAPLDSLEALSQIAGVAYVRFPFPAQEQGVPAQAAAAPDAPQVGTQTTEGVVETNADHWQASGYNGNGVNLAVFDFGFTGWTARKTSGDLPTGAVAKDYSAAFSFTDNSNQGTAGYDHGTACAEIAYDMAPAATVYLYAWSTEAEFGNAVLDYRNKVSGNRVATMSIGFVNAGPYDGTGSINTIVDGAQTAGIFWANSAGNYQKTHYSGTSAPSGMAKASLLAPATSRATAPHRARVQHPAGTRITRSSWSGTTGTPAAPETRTTRTTMWSCSAVTGSTSTNVTGSYKNQCTCTPRRPKTSRSLRPSRVVTASPSGVTRARRMPQQLRPLADCCTFTVPHFRDGSDTLSVCKQVQQPDDRRLTGTARWRQVRPSGARTAQRL